ncbi:MAG: ribosome biogenesis GTP-binding protein YihA/YsxC [Bacteriovoracaceae bacterium]
MITLPRGKAEFIMGINDPVQLDLFLKQNSHIIGVAFVGRSNVGKSSLINSLWGNKTARVSNTPGRTREINIFKFRLEGAPEVSLPDYYLFDLPGYGFAEASKQTLKVWNNLMAVFFSFASMNIGLISIQDARHPDQETDKTFYKFMKDFDYECILALNKIDKLKTQKEKNALKNSMPEFLAKYKEVKQVFYLSAEKQTGVKEFHDTIVAFLLKKTEINYKV